MTTNVSSLSFIWSLADLIRGDFIQFLCGRTIMPFTVLRRLECVLIPSKTQVLAMVTALLSAPVIDNIDLLGWTPSAEEVAV